MRTDPRGFPSWPEAVTASLRGRIHWRGRFFIDDGSLRIRGGPYIFAEDNRLNVYAGKLEVRPPAAPTIRPVTVAAESASALPIDLRDVWMTERCAARTLCRTLEFAEISSLLVK
jgi:hypothetical protein